jgi:ribosome recycling factor
VIEDILSECKAGMEKTVGSLGRELSRVRTGRANPAILEGVRVDYYGSPTPINQMATVAVPESRLIVISPWEQSKAGDIAKAIQAADLGITPQTDGKVVRLAFPPLTEERRRELVKLVKKIGEDHKIVVRKERRDANDMLKELQKDGDIAEDDAKKATDRVQKMHDDYITKVDEALAKKEAEIMEI